MPLDTMGSFEPISVALINTERKEVRVTPLGSSASHLHSIADRQELDSRLNGRVFCFPSAKKTFPPITIKRLWWRSLYAINRRRWVSRRVQPILRHFAGAPGATIRYPAVEHTFLRSHREETMLTRRDAMIGAISVGALMPTKQSLGKAAQPATPVNFDVPADACDCHTHIHGDPEQFPFFAGRIYTPETALPGRWRRSIGRCASGAS